MSSQRGGRPRITIIRTKFINILNDYLATIRAQCRQSPSNGQTNYSIAGISHDLTKKLQYIQAMAFDEKDLTDMKSKLLAEEMRISLKKNKR